MNVVSIHSSPLRQSNGQGTEDKRHNAAELRRSVVAMIEVHGRSLREVGRTYGLTDRTVLDLLLEGEAEARAKAIRLAFDNGRRSTLPPLNAMKRAA